MTSPKPLSKSPLSHTEHQVLVRIADGLTYAAIGADLGMMPYDTVKTHVSNILYKLDARNQVQAVAIGYRRRLLGHEIHAVPPVPIPAPLPDATLPRPADRDLPSAADALAVRCAIGATFRALRLERGWSQPETGKPIYLAASEVSRTESGRRSPDVDRVVMLCAALGVSPVEVWQRAQDLVYPQGWPHKVTVKSP